MALPPSASGANIVTTGSPYGVITRLATPTVLAMLAQSAVNEIDIIFFSWLPGAEASNAQAALLPCLILLWLFGGSLSAISVGTQAIAARRFAENKPLEAGAVLANSWMFSLIAGTVFTLIGRIPELYVTVLGALKQRAVVAPLFSAFGPEPIRERVQRGRGRVLVTTRDLYERKVAPVRHVLPSLRDVLIVDGDRVVPDSTDALGPLLVAATIGVSAGEIPALRRPIACT